MNQCDGIKEGPLWGPVVQTWEPSQTKYQFPYQYARNLEAEKIVALWKAMPFESVQEYSSRKKAFYPVVPYNTHFSSHAPVGGRFDFSRLKQTKVLDVIHPRKFTWKNSGRVSLAQTISPLLDKMGTIEDLSTGQNLGTCTLISYNLVLVARHVVEGHKIRNLKVTFGYTEYNGSIFRAGWTRMDRVIENDTHCDYAINQIQEPLGKRLGFVSLNAKTGMNIEPALLHYPLGKSLRVSVHTFAQSQNHADYLTVFHDSDSLSSGGAYFDPMGRMIALHLGAQLEKKTSNLLRYALPLELIVKQNPHSLLGKFTRDELSQADTFTSDPPLTFLRPSNHHFLIDEEGRESEKILRQLLQEWSKVTYFDPKIEEYEKNGLIVFSEKNLNYIKNTYPDLFDTFLNACIGITGEHKVTKEFSAKKHLESDHTLPHCVWKKTTNQKLNQFVKGKGNRPGENDMPAIVLPYKIHRKLKTTGGVSGSDAFCNHLTTLCDDKRIPDALIECYKEYKRNNFDLQGKYKKNIKKSLYDFVKKGVISIQERKKIIQEIF